MFDSVEDAFKDLDKQEYWPFADALANYRQALLDKGFTRREAMRLIEMYAKFIYEWALEEALSKNVDDDIGDLPDLGDDGDPTS